MEWKWSSLDDLEKMPKLVVIGGGTGLSILLRGLKYYTPNITAIVTVADDGGSSGVLREDLGILPPGDIRECLLALANMEPKMKKLFQYRFEEGSLKGQNFGNLFIAAMNGIHGSFEMAIKETSDVLAITGRVLPMTLDRVSLFAELRNGMVFEGESLIPQAAQKNNSPIKRIFIKPELSNPLREGVEAIKEADLIILGPGSLYTSIIPNLLVDDISNITAQAKGKKVYISNIMTQPGETDNYSIRDHVEAILDHSREDLLDYIIVNTEAVPETLKEKYILENAIPIEVSQEDLEYLREKNINLIAEKLFYLYDDYIRHDYKTLSEILMNIVEEKS